MDNPSMSISRPSSTQPSSGSSKLLHQIQIHHATNSIRVNLHQASPALRLQPISLNQVASGSSSLKADGRISPLHQQQKVTQRMPMPEAEEQDVQSLLSLAEAQQLARGTLRALYCPWRESDCLAVLASVDLLEKHLERHYPRTTRPPHQPGLDRTRPDIIMIDHVIQNVERANVQLASHRCRWERCPASFIEIDSLQAHVSTHIRKLVNDYCPHKDCGRPDIPSEKLAIHTTKGSSHPLPWTLADLRPSPAPRLVKPPKPPLFPPHLVEVPSYRLGVIAHPFVPPPPVPAAMRKIVALPMKRDRSRNRSRSETPPESHEVFPIVPNRDSLLFVPRGESIVFNSLDAATSSIFPSTRQPFYHDERHEQMINAENKRIADILSRSQGKRYVEFAIAPRPKMMRRPLLWNGPIAYARKRRQELKFAHVAKMRRIQEEERMWKESLEAQSERSKSVERTDQVVVDDDSANVGVTVTVQAAEKAKEANDFVLPKFGLAQIHHASHQRATRILGRSIGMPHFELRLGFEQAGVEMGELQAGTIPLD